MLQEENHMSTTYNILFVEDEQAKWEELTDFFKPEINQGTLSVDFAATASEGLRKVKENKSKTDLVVIDIILPDIPTNNELYLINSLDEEIINNDQNTKGILTSAHINLDALKDIEMQKKWIVDSFAKPYRKKPVVSSIQKVLNLNNNKINTFRDEIGHELYEEINQQTEGIKFKLRRSVKDLIEAGKAIKLVKAKLPHGYFKPWIDSELQVHCSTVNNLIRVAEVFGDDVDKITRIGVVPTILYFLSAPSTPPEAREKVIELIEDGENVSFTETKRIIKDYKEREKNLSQENPNISTESNESTQYNKHHDSVVVPQKQQIVEVIPSNAKIAKKSGWLLVGDLSIFNGRPDDIEFRQSLPSEIALTIAFPPSKSYSLDQLIPPQSRSLNLFYSPFKDELDATEFSNMVQESVELCTEGRDIVLFSYLPGLELIQIALELGCKCIVVDEDLDKCQEVKLMSGKIKPIVGV